VDAFAHQAAGIALYGVPVGMLAMVGVRFVTSSVATRFRVGRDWAELLGPAAPLRVTLLSLLIGAATHVAWDSVTHKTGWLVAAWPALREPLFPLLGRMVRAQHLLWYISSFGGGVAVYWAFDRSARQHLGLAPLPRQRLALNALLAAALVLPIAGIHHLMVGPIGNILTAALSLSLVLWVVAGLKSPQPPPAGR
jgi:hypothetical protein